MRRATHSACSHAEREQISIHALREEGDGCIEVWVSLYWDISIHALREEGDPVLSHRHGAGGGISIHALRGEGDFPFRAGVLRVGNFYPRPPRGGRPESDDLDNVLTYISIHALREEGDLAFARSQVHLCGFLSTPSVRRATA